MTFCLLASNIIGIVVGGQFSSVWLIIIVTLICYIIVVDRKYCKTENVNIQEVELQICRCPRTTQTATRTDPSKTIS